MSWYSDKERFDEYDPPFCRDCTKDTDKAACDRCFSGHFEGEEDDDEDEEGEEDENDGGQ